MTKQYTPAELEYIVLLSPIIGILLLIGIEIAHG